MKRIILTLLAVVSTAVFVQAQQTTFVKGDNVAGIGIGIGGALYSGSGYTSKIPFISLNYEHCVKDNLFDDKSSLGVGGLLGYTSAKWEYYGYGWKYTSFVIGVRGALHYQFVDKLDTYTSLMLGYNIVSSKTIGNIPAEWGYSATGSSFAWSWTVGARYWFSDKFAATAELGFGVAILNLGVAVKF